MSTFTNMGNLAPDKKVTLMLVKYLKPGYRFTYCHLIIYIITTHGIVLIPVN